MTNTQRSVTEWESPAHWNLLVSAAVILVVAGMCWGMMYVLVSSLADVMVLAPRTASAHYEFVVE